MKQVVIPRYGPPDVLEVRDAPEPAVKPGTVRIRVKAAGINFSDLLARQGLYPGSPKPPAVVGYEVAGERDDGEKVVALTKFGGQSEIEIEPLGAARDRYGRQFLAVNLDTQRQRSFLALLRRAIAGQVQAGGSRLWSAQPDGGALGHPAVGFVLLIPGGA